MKSIRRLFEHFKETFTEPLSDQTLAISHGDCIEDALTLKKMIEDEYGPARIHHQLCRSGDRRAFRTRHARVLLHGKPPLNHR